jgi:hypothetical protein
MRTTIGDPKHDPMREEEWLAWTDPREMAEFLQGAVEDRKLRLAGVAWVQLLPEFIDACYGVSVGDYDLYLQRNTRYPFIANELRGGDDKTYVLECMGKLVKAVEVAERFADGRASPEELALAHHAASEVDISGSGASYGDDLLHCSVLVVSAPSAYEACLAVRNGHMAAGSQWFTPEIQPDLRTGCDILRDVIGNPYRPTPTVDSSVFAWNNQAITQIARAIYAERTFDQLPILADALEEAGCSNEAILTHCRGAQRHWKGCWAVDLLLPEESRCNG